MPTDQAPLLKYFKHRLSKLEIEAEDERRDQYRDRSHLRALNNERREILKLMTNYGWVLTVVRKRKAGFRSPYMSKDRAKIVALLKVSSSS